MTISLVSTPAPSGPVPLPSVPLPSAPVRSATELLAAARRGLLEAAAADRPGERYAAAHLSALRSAAAVLAARAQPTPGSTPLRSSGRGPGAGPARAGGRMQGRPTSAWVLLSTVAPELGEWAAFFAAGAAKRAAAEAGLPRAVSTREADDLLRDAETFLAVVETTLGLVHQPLLDLTS